MYLIILIWQSLLKRKRISGILIIDSIFVTKKILDSILIALINDELLWFSLYTFRAPVRQMVTCCMHFFRELAGHPGTFSSRLTSRLMRNGTSNSYSCVSIWINNFVILFSPTIQTLFYSVCFVLEKKTTGWNTRMRPWQKRRSKDVDHTKKNINASTRR